MSEKNLEEEIDILECVYDNIDFAISMFNDLSSEMYKTIVSQMQELLNDIDYILIDKQEQLDDKILYFCFYQSEYISIFDI